MLCQPLLVGALEDLALELEALNTGADQTDDIQCVLRKVALNAKSVIAKIGSPNVKLLNHMDKNELTMVDSVDTPGSSSLVKINPKQSAMLNHVVLSCVFEKMNAVDLLNLRLVCKKWDLLIMETISNPSNKKSLKAILDEDNMHKLDLSYLNQMSGYSRKFPISILQLNLDFWDTEREDISLFSDIHREHIKTLIIKDCVRSNQALDFRDLLTNHFGSVEHLMVKTMLKNDFFDDWHLELFEDVFLPSLKTIDFDGNLWIHNHVISSLLGSAFNLESVSGQSPRIVSAVGALHKVETMKTIQISGSATVTVKALADLIPKLTHLDIDRAPSPRTHNFDCQLNRIFETSRYSLESLRIPALKLGLRKYTGIKTMPNLKRLHLYHPSGKEDKKKRMIPIFPERTILAKKFPQLNTLVLELAIFDKPSILEYFPGENYSNWFDKSIDKLVTLQNLELDCKFITQFGLRSLARKFPNVRSIKAKNIYDIFQNEGCIWYLPWVHLEALELRGFKFETDLDLYQSLDSLFTGFPDSICRNLRELRKAGAGGKNFDVDMKILQTKGSVRDLQNLKKLKIVFDHESNSELRAVADKEKLNVLSDSGEPLITELTCLYAFNVMPTLHRVIIAYDHHQQNSPAIAAAFGPLTDFVFVTIDHEPLMSRTKSI